MRRATPLLVGAALLLLLPLLAIERTAPGEARHLARMVS